MKNFRKSSLFTKLLALGLLTYLIFISIGFYSAISSNFSLLSNGTYNSIFGLEEAKHMQTVFFMWTEKTFISLANKGVFLSLICAFFALNRELKDKNYNFGYLLYFLIPAGLSLLLSYSFFGSSLGHIEAVLVKSFLILAFIVGGYIFWNPKDKQTRIFYVSSLLTVIFGLYFLGILSF